MRLGAYIPFRVNQCASKGYLGTLESGRSDVAVPQLRTRQQS